MEIKPTNIYCMDSSVGLSFLEDCSVDLTVTSPPYDALRLYNGYSFDFETIAKQLFRVTKPQRNVVWVVGDQTKDGCESLTSFKQALFFQSIGFSVETMIYKKKAVASRGSRYLYEQSFEYMFVFTKGRFPLVSNLIRDVKNKYAGHSTRPNKTKVNGTKVREKLRIIPDFSKRHNVWEYGGGDKVSNGHPAVFPLQLAEDHILSWSNEGDIVLDPFMGSGTTAVAAKKNNRKYIGFDISQEYVDLANKIINGIS